jgi:CheY-like chemotaxis protein
MKLGKNRIVALVSDLLFTVKINEAAKRSLMNVEYVKTDEDFLSKIRETPAPQLVIMDLNITSASAVDLIDRMKRDEDTKGISVMGYVSHVQGDLKVKAQEAGADVVVARSAFSQNLPQILKRHSGVP